MFRKVQAGELLPSLPLSRKGFMKDKGFLMALKLYEGGQLTDVEWEGQCSPESETEVDNEVQAQGWTGDLLSQIGEAGRR